MQLKHVCTECDGTGKVRDADHWESPSDIDCKYCQGIGYSVTNIIGDDFTNIIDKIQEVKTKINQMQADINYIKAKVG